MSEDLNRLPKWAQHRIAKLEADVAYHREQAHGVANVDKGCTDTAIEVMTDGPEHWRLLGLPQGSTVWFNLGSPDDTVAITVQRAKNGTLYVNTPRGALRVQPASTNALAIFVGESV